MSVATRCPHCGHGFPPDLIQHPAARSGPRWLPPALVLAGIAAVVVAATLAGRGGDERPTPAAKVLPATPVGAPPSPPPDTALTVDPLPSEAPAPAPVPRRRYATTWVNVRDGPGGAARIVRILNPGDSVLVDSLQRGWYRVVSDGGTVGYVLRRYLDTLAGEP